jgi:hypothetical protein
VRKNDPVPLPCQANTSARMCPYPKPATYASELLETVCDELNPPAAGNRSIKLLIDALNRHLLESHSGVGGPFSLSRSPEP